MNNQPPSSSLQCSLLTSDPIHFPLRVHPPSWEPNSSPSSCVLSLWSLPSRWQRQEDGKLFSNSFTSYVFRGWHATWYMADSRGHIHGAYVNGTTPLSFLLCNSDALSSWASNPTLYRVHPWPNTRRRGFCKSSGPSIAMSSRVSLLACTLAG